MAKGLVAVLGSFDTWTYMEYVCRIVAGEGYVARTSKYEYGLDPTAGLPPSIIRVPFGPAPGEPMIIFLRNTVIGKASRAVVVYSVSAGHYNEVAWCAELNKPTLAIAFVRDVESRPSASHCSELLVPQRPPDPASSACGGGLRFPDWTDWHCIQAAPCPFKDQGVSKNQLEYFHANNSFMHLYAVEFIENCAELIRTFLAGTLGHPPFVVAKQNSSYHNTTFPPVNPFP